MSKDLSYNDKKKWKMHIPEWETNLVAVSESVLTTVNLIQPIFSVNIILNSDMLEKFFRFMFHPFCSEMVAFEKKKT